MAGASADIDLALKTLALKMTCSHCGKQCSSPKRCSTCKHASYCGAECQKAGLKKHKKTCAPLLSVDEVWEKVRAGCTAGDWRGLLRWEGRMEELMEGQSDARCCFVLLAFSSAHSELKCGELDSKTDHLLSAIGLLERRVDLLGKMQRFRDQGEAMCTLAAHFNKLGGRQVASNQYEMARAVGAAHGFFSVECTACEGLGRLAFDEGRHEEGVELLKNALVAARLGEDKDTSIKELSVLCYLIPALFRTNAVDELEPLVVRFREATHEESQRDKCLDCRELCSLHHSARLHEVLRMFANRAGNPFSLLGPCIPPRLIANANGSTAPKIRQMHHLNLPLFAGTWEASRGREGNARAARPHAREQGSSASLRVGMSRAAACSLLAAQDSRPEAWSAGAHRVRGG